MGDEFDDLGFEEDPADDLGFTPQGYADARVMTMPETDVVGDPAGGGSATMRDEPVTVETQRRKEWVTDEGAANPAPQPPGGDPRGLAERLRQYASGSDPEALGTGWEILGNALGTGGDVPVVGGREFPSLPSVRRAARADDVSDAVVAAMPAAPFADGEHPASGIDQRPWASALGATDIASFGWVDELAGGIGGQGRRDYERQASTQAEEQAPTEYAIGQVAGAAPLALLPGAGPTAGARMAIAGGTGLGAGMLRGGGESEAEDFGGRLRDSAQQGALEGLVSAGTAGVAEGARPAMVGLGRAVEGAGDWLRGARTEARLEAANLLPNPSPRTRYGRHVQRLGGQRAVADMLDAEHIGGRVLPTGASQADMDRLAAGAGAQFDDVHRQMDEAGGGVLRTDLADRVTANTRGLLGDISTGPAERAVSRVQSDYVDPLLRRAAPGPMGQADDLMGWQQAHNLRQHYDEMSGALSRSTDPADVSTAGGAQVARDEVSGLMNESLDAVDPALRDTWRTANRRYSLLSLLRDNARESGNRTAGAFAEAGALGDLHLGTAAVARTAGNLLTRYRPGVNVRAMDALLPALERGGPALQRAGQVLRGAQQQGPAAVSAAHYLLARQSPEYRRAHDEAAEQAAEESD